MIDSICGCDEFRRMSRRRFLARGAAGVGALALADPLLRSVASTYASTMEGTGNLLVLCHMNGGLDALSFLVPHQNAVYASRRPSLAVGTPDVLPLHDHPEYGFHRRFSIFDELYALGHVAVVQQVHYPGSSQSHFASTDIYEYGVRNLASRIGTQATWYERLRQTYFNRTFGVLDTLAIGDPQRFGYPDATHNGAAQTAFGELARGRTGRTDAERAMRAAYDRIDRTTAELRTRTAAFSSTGTARGEFYRAAQLASADLGTQIVKLRYVGFDTHVVQEMRLAALFDKLNAEFRQFVQDMQAIDMWDRTCVVFFSEFGRRNYENGSPGTDHGSAGHMIVVGPGVNGGLHGQNVTTADLSGDALPFYVDFRAVFGDCIRDWLGFDPRPIFRIDGETYDENIGSALFS